MITENLEILHTVYKQENGKIYSEIIENEFIEEYLVVEVMVTNAFIHTETYFTNDLEESYDQHIIFSVEELNQIEDLRTIIENGRVIPHLNTLNIVEVA